jgi:enterochelin esterase-like enzyme
MSKPSYAAVMVIAGLLTALVAAPASARPPRDGGGVLAIGESVQGDLLSGERDTWTFMGRTGQRVTVSMERAPADQPDALDPYIELIAPDGTLVAADDNSGPVRDAILLGAPLPMNGLYSIQARSSDQTSPGVYQLTLVENVLPSGCESLQGTVAQVDNWYSPIARETLRYRVYLPPCYQSSGKRYPYVILMHGSNTDDSHWDRLGIDEAITRGVALGRLPPLAVVLPYGGVMANTNVFWIDGSYEYVILNELMPTVESSFCLRQDPQGRAIGGISRGGFWAYLIGLRHPEFFDAVGGHSPFFDLYHAPDTHNPLALALSVAWPENAPRLYMDRGKDDYAQVNIDLMVSRLTQHAIPHTFVLHPAGEHEDAYWAAHVDEYLAFYAADWSGGIDTYPPCDLAVQ